MRLRRSQNTKNQQQQALYHYLDQKGLLHCLYCPSYQYLIIAAALPGRLPPIAARNLEHSRRFETKIILYT
jgi:hypothetical protein